MSAGSRVAALLQKLARLDPRALTAGDVLAMATLEGARAGLEGFSRLAGSRASNRNGPSRREAR